jgi:hypothetical protein
MKSIVPILLAVATAVTSGCASYKKNFQSTTVVNIGSFADSTITLLSDLDLTMSREETLLVRRFIDESAPEEQLVIQFDDQLKKDVGNMVRYSIEIVNIAESDLTETNKIYRYADYLVSFRDGLIEKHGVNLPIFDQTIEDVMAQTEFLEALRKAQPLLNAAVMAAALDVDELIDAIEALTRKVDNRIDEEYADIIRYRAKLEREKFDILTAFEIIYDAYRLDEPNLGALRDSGVIWTPEIIPEGRPTRDDLKNIGEHLHARLQALDIVQNEMQPNWEDYMATHKELDAIGDQTIQNAHEARIPMLTWVRAHQKMTSGMTDPAGWFDVGEVTKSLIKSAPGALL